MNLARMMTDKFFIENRDGMRSGPFKTKFGGGTLMVFHDNLDIAENDRIIRPLPDGGEQVYIVESSSFSTGSRNIPGHFSISISEQIPAPCAPSSPAAQPAAAPASCSPVFEVNLPDVAASMQALAQAIERSEFPTEQKDAARAILHALRENRIVAAALAAGAQTG